MPNDIKITVITVSYNSASEIEATILSVLNQKYDNIEYMIIDGGSTDGTVDVIRRYADRLSYWVSEPDGGIYYAMNKGVGHAMGKYVNFMNAGDIFFDDNVLSDVFNGGEDYDEDVIYCSNLIHYAGGYKAHHPYNVDLLRRGIMPFCHQSTFTKVSVLKERPFDTEFRLVSDCLFMRRLYEAGGTFRKVNKYVAIYDANGVSSVVNLELYYELCKVAGKKPTMKGFLAEYFNALWRPLRYCRLKMWFKGLYKPEKYSVSRKKFKQLA